MKKILFITIVLLSIISFGQEVLIREPIQNIGIQGITPANDTIIKVSYKNEDTSDVKKPAFF